MLAENPETGKLAYKEVVQTFVRDTDKTVHVRADGIEIETTSVEQYLRKAEGFMKNLRGAKKYFVDGAVKGVVRYVKNGKYIDLAPDGTIVSFGRR